MNDNIIKLSPAKINLYLEVLEKTSSGYHNIESLMTFCDFGDIISIKKHGLLNLQLMAHFQNNFR